MRGAGGQTGASSTLEVEEVAEDAELELAILLASLLLWLF